jgi:hypothetical protein
MSCAQASNPPTEIAAMTKSAPSSASPALVDVHQRDGRLAERARLDQAA